MTALSTAGNVGIPDPLPDPFGRRGFWANPIRYRLRGTGTEDRDAVESTREGEKFAASATAPSAQSCTSPWECKCCVIGLGQCSLISETAEDLQRATLDLGLGHGTRWPSPHHKRCSDVTWPWIEALSGSRMQEIPLSSQAQREKSQ